MATRQDGGFPPVARRHYSTGSSQIPTELLQSINPYPIPYPNFYTNFNFNVPVPTMEPRPRSMSSSRLPPKKPRSTHRKMSMNERVLETNDETFVGSWSSVPSLAPGSFEEEQSPITPAQGLASLYDDKKQRRRECHNQVEKRRRENINARIEELSVLLPPHYKNVEEDEEVRTSFKTLGLHVAGQANSRTRPRTKNRPSARGRSSRTRSSTSSQSLIRDGADIRELQSTNTLLYTRIAQLEAAMSSSWPTFPQQQFPLQQMEKSPEPEFPAWQNYTVQESAIVDSSPDQDSPYEEELNLGMQSVTW